MKLPFWEQGQDCISHQFRAFPYSQSSSCKIIRLDSRLYCSILCFGRTNYLALSPGWPTKLYFWHFFFIFALRVAGVLFSSNMPCCCITLSYSLQISLTDQISQFSIEESSKLQEEEFLQIVPPISLTLILIFIGCNFTFHKSLLLFSTVRSILSLMVEEPTSWSFPFTSRLSQKKQNFLGSCRDFDDLVNL